VFRQPESPLRARELRPLQRLSYLASLLAYLAPPMRLLLLATLALVLWTGVLPMKVSVLALIALWLPAVALNLMAGSALARGHQRIAETTHFELLTREIYSRALRCAVLPGRTTFKVTPKHGIDPGGWQALVKLRLVMLCAVVLTGGVGLRLVDIFGPGLLPALPGIAAVVVPALGLIELRRVVRTLVLAGGRRQRRLVYRFESDAPAQAFGLDQLVAGRVVDASASGLGLVMESALPVGSRPRLDLRLADATGATHDVALRAEVRSCRQAGESFLVGASIVEIEPHARLRLMEWCYVVCSHERLRGCRPGVEPPVADGEPIVVPVDDLPEATVRPLAPAPAVTG
jgi:hypothetical protein